MAGTDFFRTFKGLSEVKLYNIKESLVYNLPVALDISIDNGIQERRIPSRNIFGEQIFATHFTVASDPILRIVFPTLAPEILEFKTGRSFAATTGGSFEYKVAKTVDPTYMAESGVNYVINLNTLIGLSATDITTIKGVTASTTSNNLSEALTVTLAADQDGSAGAWITVPKAKFQNEEMLSLLITCQDDVVNLGSQLEGYFKLFATMVTSENQLVVLTAPKVKPSFQGSNFSPSMEQIETIFYMHTPAGQCKSYDLIYTNTIVSC